MRIAGVIFWYSVVLAAMPVLADEGFPYTAYIHGNDVYVRSGPGRDYYPTDKVKKGQAVEVYRHDPGGWCAIRPLEESYSWVSARHLRPTQNGLAVVIEPKVPARIGSKFSNVREVIQVRLEEGETVAIRKEYSAGGQTWYQIEPPAGEFRWVSRKYLEQERPLDGISRPRRTPKSSEFDDQTSEKDEGPIPDPQEPQGRPRNVPKSSQPLNDPPRKSPTWDHERPRIIDADNASNDDHLATQATSTRSANSELDARLSDLDQDIGAMAVEEPTVWEFEDLNERADKLLEDASTAIERGRVRQVQKKIARLENVRNRYLSVNSLQAETDRLNNALDAEPIRVTSRRARPRAMASPQSSRFDGRGILRPVASRRPGSPHYALVDGSGLVHTFITPTPGLNLQPFVGQQIGVTGNRGFMPELRKTHVMVKQITPIDSLRR